MGKISYSQFAMWDKCPYTWKANYVDKAETFKGNIYTSFGSAIHNTIEKFLLNEVSESEQYDLFRSNFEEEISSLSEKYEDVVYDSFLGQATGIIDNYYSELKEYFGDYEIM